MDLPNGIPADGTYTIRNGQFIKHEACTGYYVAIEPVANPFDLARNETSLIGFWTDPETGKLYIDRVLWVEDKTVAQLIGTSNNEIAIWDVSMGKEIYL